MHKTLSNRLLLYTGKKIYRTKYSFFTLSQIQCASASLAKASIDLSTELTLMNWSTRDTNYLVKTHCKPIPVMKTGNSLCTFPNREKPVSITWEPCNENRFFPVWEKYTGKSLFWPCTGPVRDCSAGRAKRSQLYYQKV